ncbi:hypothetical protein [Empedobacter brevis]|uniref:hypothetical protein n=1 Tax=Empedobacter brevis TaxID=247 RepID=UPI00289635E4|nr:hypothetical protein [Empedobacter brevis]
MQDFSNDGNGSYSENGTVFLEGFTIHAKKETTTDAFKITIEEEEKSPLLKFVGMRKGIIPEFESRLMEGKGAITPAFFIIYGTGSSKDPRYANHELGHAIQFLLMRPSRYYTEIAIPSLLTAHLDNAMDMPWEKSASIFWYILTGEKDPDL